MTGYILRVTGHRFGGLGGLQGEPGGARGLGVGPRGGLGGSQEVPGGSGGLAENGHFLFFGR